MDLFEGLFPQLKLYYLTYQKFTVEKNKNYAEQLIEVVENIVQYSKDNELLNTFDSRTSAAQYCLDNNLTNCKLSTARTHICEVCSGKRKTFAKFIWKDE